MKFPISIKEEYYNRLSKPYAKRGVKKLFIDQFMSGSGNELKEKFWSPRSSARLCFDLYSWMGEDEGFDDVERITGGELIEKIGDAYSTYGEDDTIILCRSNKRAIRYNAGIRGTVQFKEEKLVRDDKLMIVKNCYQFVDNIENLDYIANGDIAKFLKISKYEDRYGRHFAEARLELPDYDNQEIVAKVILDTLDSESPSLTYDQQNMLYVGVDADYQHIKSKKKRYEAVREDHYYNALQLKYANAITCHKSQGGQWKCVFIDNPFWQGEYTLDDLKWLYTAMTRATEKVYLVNFKDEMFI
jgi:exodeoxyribonuclease-5